MEGKICRICGNYNHNNICIFKSEDLKTKIETCLPIIVLEDYMLPNIICTDCFESVNMCYIFIKRCVQNITRLETQYNIKESCLRIKRKKDVEISVDPLDLPIKLLKIPEINYINLNLSLYEPKETKLVDYDVNSDSDEETSTSICKIAEKPVAKSENTDIISEIVHRKNLKRKFESLGSPENNLASKIQKIENTNNRRKKSRPKKIESHWTPEQPPEQNVADVSVIPEPLNIPQINPQNQMGPQNCLLCDIKVSSIIALASHMYDIHGLDLTQIYNNSSQIKNPMVPELPAGPKKKIPELLKISELGIGKLPSKLTVEYSGNQLVAPTTDDILEIMPAPNENVKPTMSSLNDSLFICSECPSSKRNFTNFPEFSSHRRSQHQIFHCDLCPKFYGRNSHLWKHVNRVHKGHSAVTCSECGKTSASEYHLQQHKNKMHSSLIKDKNDDSEKTITPSDKKSNKIDRNNQKTNEITATIANNIASLNKVAKEATQMVSMENKVSIKNEINNEINENDLSSDEDDLLNKKFEGFDFKSVKQSFLRQELISKRERYVSVLKKNNIFSEISEIKSEKGLEKKDVAPPREIDSSSDLYTTIITNYTPPVNEGPFKCPKCLKGFHKKNLLKKHKKNCRPRLQKDLLTRCKTCSRIFKDRQSLSKHLINYHSKYTCEICNLAVSSKCEIVSHIRFTHPNSELQCYCGQILRSKNDLLKHKSEHRDSYVCQFCADMLPTKIKLKMHILSLHRKILALSCGICLKLFENQHILRAHVKFAHSSQLKPLTSCTICGKNYGSKWKTYDHLNKSHGRIFKACKNCLEVFETEKELQLHFEREHLNSSQNNAPVTPQTAAKPQEKVVKSEQKPSYETKTEQKPSDKTKTPKQEDFNQFIGKLDSEGINDSPILSQTSKFVPQTPKNSSKVSLLEKRLLGTKPSEIIESQSQDNNFGGLSTPQGQNSDDILHNSSKRTVYVNSNDPSLCEICLKIYPAKKHLWQHYIRCHKIVAATVCGICLKTNPSYSALERHLKDTHPKLLFGQGFGSNFICKICGRYHNASSKLRLHMAIHMEYPGVQGVDEGPNDSQMEVQESQEPQNVSGGLQNDVEVKMEPKDNSEDDEMDEQEYEEISSKKEEENNSSSDDNDAEDSDDDEDEEIEEDSSDSSEPDPDKNETAQKINYREKQIKNEIEDDNYYESLIEEVEASTEEENEENVDENSLSDSPKEDLEQEMLRNMITESRNKKFQHLSVKSEPNAGHFEADDQNSQILDEIDLENGQDYETYELDVIKEEYVKSEQNSSDVEEIDDEMHADELDKDEIVEETDEEDLLNESDEEKDVSGDESDLDEISQDEILEDDNSRDEISESEISGDKILENSPNELDSAIRSICSGNNDDDFEPEGGSLDPDVVEMSENKKYKRIHRVNESELAKAVGSIL